MAEDPNIPIAQVIRNYTTNLPFFPPLDLGLLGLHGRMIAFYNEFIPAAQASSIPATEQVKVLERVADSGPLFGRVRWLHPDRRIPFYSPRHVDGEL